METKTEIWVRSIEEMFKAAAHLALSREELARWRQHKKEICAFLKESGKQKDNSQPDA